MDYQKNQKYFNRPLTLSDIIGILFMLGAILEFASGNWGAAFASLVSGILFVVTFPPKTKATAVSDSEYDSSVSGYANSLSRTRALQKFGVDESEVNEITPIIMGGYDFKGADNFKEGADKLWRSNVYKVVMLFFSRSELYCYEARFKTTEDKILSESTDVYFYQDIVSASTASVSETVKTKDKEVTINSEAFKLTTKGGTSITVNNIVNSQKVQESVNAMRALLREKKQA